MYEQLSLSWDLHSENRTSSLSTLWREEAFLDVTIICDDDQIDAHKLMLSAASPLFQKILLRNQNLAGRPLLYLKGTRKKDMQTLLNFIYEGEATVQKDDVEDFMQLANSLDVKGLVADKSERRNIQSQLKEIKDTVDHQVMDGIEWNESSSEQVNYPLNDMHLRDETYSDDIRDDNNAIEFPDESITSTPMKCEVIWNDDKKTSVGSATEEYDKVVEEMICKSGSGTKAYSCKKCSYSGSKNHLREHVGKHIEGFSFPCNFCGKTFGSKKNLRMHSSRKCKSVYHGTV